MSDTVRLKIKLEGSDSINTVTLSASELSGAIDKVKKKTEELSATIVNMAATAQVADLAAEAFRELNQVMSSLTASYREQKEADTKLEVAMRNTMDATTQEIESIKEFIDAQERVGVVSGDVQTAAAQELSTYLGLSSSLKTIIPTMNDMIVQQLGMNASADSAVQIATMLGKVMNGQTKALSRYGYEFSEAQEYILQFGDETERAAVLCEVIGQSVGGMNEKFAQTDIGRQKQMADTIGKMKEEIGGLVIGMEPWINGLANVGYSVSGVIKLGSAFKALAKTEIVAAANAKIQAAAQKILEAAGYSAAAGTTALRIATAALYATMTLGISLAVTGLITLFTKLGQKGNEAADSIEKAKEADDAFGDASMDMRLKLAEETIQLEALIKKKKDTADAVRHLNAEYGSVFGTYGTASEWYDVLTTKSAAYCRQLGYEAKAKVLAAQSGEKQVALDDLRKQLSGMEESGPQPMKRITEVRGGGYTYTGKEETEYSRLKAQEAALATEVAELTSKFEECMAGAAAAADEMGTVAVTSEEAAKATQKLKDDLVEYRKSVDNAVAGNAVFGGSIDDADARLKAMKSGLTSLINKYGTESTAIQNLIAEYGKLARERSKANDLGDFKPTALPDSYNVKEFKDGRMTERKVSSKVTGMNTALNIPRPTRSLTDFEQAVELYKKLQNQLATASPEAAKGIQETMNKLDQMYDITGKGNTKLESTIDTFGTLSNVMRGLSGVVGEAAGAWLEWGANLLQVIAQALPQLTTLFAAHTAVAASGAAESVASVPYVGPILAVAAIASVLAAMAAVPKFANGGIAYGPTLGLFGEYSNASSNPEVVAPLDRLRSLIGDGSQMYGDVRFEIEGSKLVGVLERRYNKLRRTNG